MKTISKRFLKASLAMLLVVVMLLGSTITGFAAVVDKADTKANVDLAETSASITSDGTARLYFNMSAVLWWTAGSNGNGNFAYFFNNSTGKNAWSAHAEQYNGSTYYVTIPSGSWLGVILTRNNTSTSPSWDNKWNQTGDITLSSSSNYLSKFSEGSTSVTWGTAVKPASKASVSASPTTVATNTNVTLTPSLSSNANINTIKSTSYSISPSSGASVSSNTFTATSAGTYTVTATVTYYPKGYSNLTSTATATTTITVTDPTYSYSVVSNDTNKGTVSDTGNGSSVNKGESVTITATPKAGYKFDGWSATNGDLGSSSSAETTFKPIANNAKATATFSAITKNISYVTYDGDTATYSPATYSVDNTTVTLPTQVERTGYVFAGWYDNADFTGSAITSFTPSASNLVDKTFYAKWNKKHHIVVGAVPNDGTGGTATITNYGNYADVVEGTQLVLVASANTGYHFTGWYIDDELKSSSSPYVYTVGTSDTTLTAKFELNEYTISASASIADGGTVTLNDEQNSVTIEHGESVSLLATANSGYDFRGWKRVGNDTTTFQENPLVITPDSDAEYIANFVKVWSVKVVVPEGMKKVSLNESEGVTTNSDKTYTVNDGVISEVTGVASEGYRLIGWKVTQNNTTNEYSTETVAVTINTDTKIEPIVVKTYNATSKAYTTYVDVSTSNAYGGIVKINGNDRTATVDEGEAVTYTAVPYTYYEFIGWYNSSVDFATSEPISKSLSYTVTESADSDVHLVALFARVYKILGAYSGKFEYDSKTNTYSFVPNNYIVGQFNVLNSADAVDTNVKNGNGTVGGTLSGTNSPFTFTIGEDYDPAKDITFTLSSTDRGQSFVLDITAQPRNSYEVSLADGLTGTGIGPTLAGKPVLITINCSDTQAISSYSFETEGDYVVPDDARKIGNNQISFTMPEGNVELKVTIAQMYKVYADTTYDTGLLENAKYYLPGETITYPLTPTSAKVSIMTDTIKLIPVTNFTYAAGSNGVYNLTFTMPNEDVKIQATTEASFQVNVTPVVKDYFNTNGATYCSVDINAFGITDDNYVANNTVVTLKASSKQTTDYSYQFLGYYDENDKLISENPLYSFIPLNDINYKAVFVRNVYIVGDVAEGEDVYTPMEYDIDTDTYSYEPDVANGTFVISPIADSSSSSYKTVWNQTTITATGVTHSTKGTLGGLKSDYTMPLTITFSKNSSTSYSATVTAKEVAANVYLSSGRLDYDRRQSTYFSTNTNFIDYESKYTVGSKVNAVNESYIPAHLPHKDMTIRVQTVISGSAQELYDVEYYYVYDVATAKSTAVVATPLGNGVYEAAIEVTGTTYIVPLFFANQNYLDQVGGKRVQIYVDPREFVAAGGEWGDFMACYPYGRNKGENDDHDLTGHWPGQLMIPLDDGTFKTSVVIGDGTNESLSGLVFNNYLSDKDSDTSTATKLKSELGMSGVNFVQTYDYREAVYLDEGKYDVITYKLKKNNDGYHGNRMGTESGTASGTYRVTSGATIAIDNSHYKFSPLMDRNGEYPMDFNGKSIKTENPTTAYYVVAEGDVNKSLENKIDSNFSGQWTVLWHVYDASGKHLGEVFSGSMYHKYSDTRSRLAEMLGVDNTALDGKQVMITYEARNKTNYYRVDGQWYGEKTAEAKIKASVVVGLYNGRFIENTDTTEPNALNINTDYGQAFIDHNGGKEQAVELAYETGSSAVTVNLTAERFGNYKIKGWYTKDANGDYVPFQTGGSTASLTIGANTVIYAFFEELAGDNLVVDHEIYSNTTDREILSLDGTATRTVEIWSYDPVTQKPIEKLDSGSSIKGSSATTPIVEGQSYLVRVKANPLGADKFNAWYMDAYRADGSHTYEEVFTDGNTVNSESEVVSEFVYTYSPDMPTHIIIYSDIKKISVEGKLIYIYNNRYGKERFITETINMTTQEIDGFAGNDNKSRMPAYKNYDVYEKKIDGVLVKEKVYTEEHAAELIKEKYELVGTGSQIGEYLPYLEVTEAVNITTEWIVDDQYYTFKYDDATIEIRAVQNPMTFNLTAYIDGVEYTKSGPYNSLIENLECSDGTTVANLTAPLKNSKDQTFSYWQSYEIVNGVKETKIISYSPYYWYRLIEDRTIEAVYGVKVEDAWTPSIEDVTYTREYGDGGDYIYTDYLIAFHSSIDEKIEDFRDTDRTFKYGLVLVRDPSVTITEDNVTNFSNYPTYDGIVDDVKDVAGGTSSVQIKDENNNGKVYNAYYFEFSDEKLTNFNRLVHAIKYDNNNKKNYKSYAFAAYAYLIIDGTTYVSAPENVNFFSLANEDVHDANQ